MLIYRNKTCYVQKKQPTFIVNAVVEGRVRNATHGSKSGSNCFISEKGGKLSFQNCMVCIFSKLCSLC